jgi:hypothetical protein
MKLKSLLNYLLENGENIPQGKILDEAALRGFSLDVLRNETERLIKKLAYPEDVGRYLRRFVGEHYNLPYMGEGSSRIVYALSTSKVLKIAKNQKGIAQNEAEKIVAQNPSTRYIGAKIYESDPDNHWSVMEIAKIYENDTQLKLDLGIPRELAERHGYDITSAAFDLTKVYDLDRSVEEVIKASFWLRVPENKKAKAIEDLRKFLEDPPKSMLALVDLIHNAPTDQALQPGDIVPDHFGKTIDGRPVLIDYGFTTGVAEEYYWSSSEDGYGSPPPSSIMSDEESLPRVSNSNNSRY